MLVSKIEQRPEGWVYKWADLPRGGHEVEEWSGRADTFEDCVQMFYHSVREKLPVGKLQGDELEARKEGEGQNERNERQGL